MKWRLGLDVGTDSLGWAALRLQNGDPTELLDMGVRIFGNGRQDAAENRVGAPLNEIRRLARQMRRQRDRKIRRKRAVARYLIASGCLPEDEKARNILFGKDPYAIRSEAVTHPIPKEDLGRILVQLASHRGFKSNSRSAATTEPQTAEDKAMYQGIDHLQSELAGKTLGQWLHERHSAGASTRFKPTVEKSKVSYPVYPSRAMYEDEFRRIRAMQEGGRPELDWDRLHKLIFFQRPLKRPERGFCQFYEEEARAYKCQPSSQRFRIIQDLLNLAYVDENNTLIPVPEAIRNAVFELLDHQKSLSFGKIRELFGESFDYKFNLEDDKRKSLKGNEIAVDMRKPEYFGPVWDSLSLTEQDSIIESLMLEDDYTVLQPILAKTGLTESQSRSTFGYELPSGTTMLSTRFMREAALVMMEKGIQYHEAALHLGFHHSVRQDRELCRSLPYYGKILKSATTGGKGQAFEGSDEEKYGRIPNPTVHIALNQIRKLVNALSRRFSPPAKIIVEVGRELKLSDERKMEMFKAQAKNQHENERIADELVQLGIVNPREYIKKYKLWEELGKDDLIRRCPYCGRSISGHQLVSADIEIEHILPYSLTLLDSMENLTVSHRECNRIKGERSPFEAFGTSPQGFDWSVISEIAAKLPPRKRRKFSPEAMTRYLEEAGFIASQMTDNAYIAKSAKEYLSAICDRNSIWTTTGRLTALLRAKWGINTILSSSHDNWKKNRTDHRHHAMDALVIALCDHSLIQKAATMNAQHGFGQIIVPDCPIPRALVAERVSTMLVSRKPDHGWQGKLFMETAMGERTFFRKIPTSELGQSDVRSIVPLRIKLYVESLLQKSKFNTAKKELVQKYAFFVLAEKKLVTRAPIHVLSARDVEDICDPLIRDRAKSAINGISDKKEIEAALRKFAEENHISTVRYFPKNTTASRIGSVYNKSYQPADFFRADIWSIPNKKAGFTYEGAFISRVEASKFSEGGLKVQRKPHPAAKHICSLYKGDVLEVEVEGRSVLCRIAGYATTRNNLDIQPLHASATINEWLANTPNEKTDPFWVPISGPQNHRSINTLFRQGEVKPVKISVDGRRYSR